jgi:hypothetical protein
MNEFSIFSLWVNPELTHDDVQKIFEDMNWGTVSKVKLVRKDFPSPHNMAYIDFSNWNHDYNSIKDNLESNKFEKIYYKVTDDTNNEFFKVFKQEIVEKPSTKDEFIPKVKFTVGGVHPEVTKLISEKELKTPECICESPTSPIEYRYYPLNIDYTDLFTLDPPYVPTYTDWWDR